MRTRWKWLIGRAGVRARTRLPSRSWSTSRCGGLTERQMNAHLKGYTARIGRLNFHPFGFAIDFHDRRLRPERPSRSAGAPPPSAEAPACSGAPSSTAGRRRLPVRHPGDLRGPHAPRSGGEGSHPGQGARLAGSAAGDVPAEDQRVPHPQRLGHLRGFGPGPAAHGSPWIESGRAQHPQREVGPRRLPSPIHIEAASSTAAGCSSTAGADFLRVPYAGVKGKIELAGIPLDYVKPIAARYG